jgi:hypothetical protein
MTSFELVFGLMTITTSLALTHLLAGCVGVLQQHLFQTREVIEIASGFWTA